MQLLRKINFPKFTGLSCVMMPFIQGEPNSLPKEYKPYLSIISENYLEKGKIGFLTIDERFVKAGSSQRGFNSAGINRNVHIEVGRRSDINCWGSDGSDGDGTNTWGRRSATTLHDNTMVLIANSISNTCRVWNAVEKRNTNDGDLSMYISDYPEESGKLLKAGELVKMSIFTPHECVNQTQSGNRQFFRIVGEGVKGRESYFTVNSLVKAA